jgi:hypothetical protein
MGARSSIRRERISFFIAFTYGEGERGREGKRGERGTATVSL